MHRLQWSTEDILLPDLRGSNHVRGIEARESNDAVRAENERLGLQAIAIAVSNNAVTSGYASSTCFGVWVNKSQPC